MATCKCGDTTVICRGKSCGCLCEVDPPGRCWATCGGVTVEIPPAAIAVSGVDPNDDVTRPIDPKTVVSVRSDGLALAELAALVDSAVADEVMVPVGAWQKSVKIEMKGTLAEICEGFGLSLRPCRKDYGNNAG